MKRTEREKKRRKGKEEKRRGTHKYVNNHVLHIVSNSDILITGTTFNQIIMELKTLQ